MMNKDKKTTEIIFIIQSPKSIIEKYPGGWENFKAEILNDTLCADGELIRIGFMTPNDVKAFIGDLEHHDIIYLEDKVKKAAS